jgi:hypothetical protein
MSGVVWKRLGLVVKRIARRLFDLDGEKGLGHLVFLVGKRGIGKHCTCAVRWLQDGHKLFVHWPNTPLLNKQRLSGGNTTWEHAVTVDDDRKAVRPGRAASEELR